MTAPDKIYLEKSLSNPDRLHSQWYPNDVIGGGIEYIRKDALMEWAKEHYTSMDITKRDMWDGGYNCAMKQLIDKINSM